ncbi:uncharacterized protein [Musca autumnalis]|uniref:uncharacterized protein n=1 Tax=Musca autumnalis TaxID=221902 RepID=UPI003CE9F94D
MSPRMVQTDPNIVRRLQISHKKSIENAKSLIDVTPTKMLATTYLNMNKLKDDFRAGKRILKDNIQLLRRINYIQRNQGKTECYNKYKGQKTTYLENLNKQRESIQKENFELGSRLLRITSTMDTRRELQEELKDPQTSKVDEENVTLKDTMLEAYMSVTSIKEKHLMEQLLRPKIFVDLYIKNLRPLGRLIIQLYTEACPDLVLEFVRLCTHNSCELIRIIRIFPLLWLEAELTVHNEMLSTGGYEHQSHCLDQSAKMGILSFAKCYLQGFPLGLLNFTISFKKLPICQDERIPFGVVTNGLRILSSLSVYGTKNGKTIKDILVVNCGVL